MPVRAVEGESPVKGGGKLIVIDGGFCRAYHSRTGTAGYTLVFNSRGLTLRTHQPFESMEAAIRQDEDIASKSEMIYQAPRRILVRDTAGLTETSQAKVRGRPCHILQSQETAGDQTVCRRIYCIDGETGLALQQSIHYGGTGGTVLSYILTCEEFQTSGVTLPEVAGAP